MKTAIAGIDRTFRRGRENMMATQWEYKLINCNLYSKRHEAEIELNKAGSDGWEAVAASGDTMSCFVILKRQKSR